MQLDVSFLWHINRGVGNTAAKMCKLEALSACCFEFLLLHFWSPSSQLYCGSGFALHVIQWESYVHGESNFVWWALDACLDSSLSSVENSQNVPVCLRGVVTHIQLWYSCAHINVTAPRQGSNCWNKLGFLARGRAERSTICLIWGLTTFGRFPGPFVI